MTMDPRTHWRGEDRSVFAGALAFGLMATAFFVPATVFSQSGLTVGEQKIAQVQREFATPPDDARIMMRWWWFGPAVTKPELQREILAMKAGGIGGFEVQPVYPLTLDDKQKNFRNLPYLSDEFLDAVSFASKTAHENGMRIDMTLASGWPYGGKYVPIDEASARLKVVAVDVPAGGTSLLRPSIGNGEAFLAAFAGDGTSKKYDAEKLKRVTVNAGDDRMHLDASPNARVVVFYIAGRTGQQVKRPSVDAEGFVLDHFSDKAVYDHLKMVGEPLMKAFGDTPPYAVFSDSLEVYDADWTDDLPSEFRRRRGYDLIDYLPQLASGTDEASAEIRHDWGVTLTELVDERYLTRVDSWAKEHQTRFRSQTYGHPAVSMSSNDLVALPEGEGPQWNRFSYTRWATSASHLYGRPVTSSETWTWLHSPPFSATPLDMKAEADRFFLEGVNQLIGHGWPYTPLGIAEPGWNFYAAAVFNDHNPWWIVMPDVTKYLQRVSYLLRQGKPANDVAVFLPDDDAYADFSPGKVSLSDEMPKYITPVLTQQILGAGHNFDYIDAESIQKVGIPYPVVVMPHVARLSPDVLKLIVAYVEGGGKVIWVGSTPDRAPGFEDAGAVSARVKKLSNSLADNKNARLVESDDKVGTALQNALQPDLELSASAANVGFIHRKLDDADVYFIANTSNQPVKTPASFRSSRRYASMWDPQSGEARELDGAPASLTFAPYESCVVVLSDEPLAKSVREISGKTQMLADLTKDWTIHFPAEGSRPAFEQKIETPHSWADSERTHYFSGIAIYSKTVHLADADLRGPGTITLDFGAGTTVAENPNASHGMRALLEGPIRDAAVVSVNGQRAGSIWHPPYALDITQWLHAGDNKIEIQVANTAINMLAGRAPTDYHLLSTRYGQRFIPMDAEDIKVQPSGILGQVHLLETK
jgi:alpha-L-rhamnosidase